MDSEHINNIKDESKKESKAVSLCEKLLKYKKSIAYTATRNGCVEEIKHMSSIFKSRKPINEVLSPDENINDMAMEMLVNNLVSKVYHKYDIKNYGWKLSSDGKGFVLTADISNFEKYYY